MHVETRRWMAGVNEPKSWIEKGARAGHIAKGAIYALIGVLALQAAWGSGGQIGGSEEAARFVHEQPFGQVLLVLLGVGLLGYAVWRFIVGVKNTEHAGPGAKGWLERAGAVASGCINTALAVLIFQTVLAHRSGGGGARSWVAALLQQPLGGVLVAIVGGVVVAAAGVQIYKAYSKSFLECLELNSLTMGERRWVTRLGQFGHAARGAVFSLIGVALIRAGTLGKANETKGTAEALRDIASSSYGSVLLAVTAAGFIAFAAFLFVSAKYRRVRA